MRDFNKDLKEAIEEERQHKNRSAEIYRAWKQKRENQVENDRRRARAPIPDEYTTARDKPGPNAAIPSMAGFLKYFWSDGGAFLWGLKPPVNWCIDLIAKVEPRIILRTPQLAGRLTDVVYVPLQHTNDPLPSQDYFVNGGVTTGRPFPSPFSEWNLAGPGPGA